MSGFVITQLLPLPHSFLYFFFNPAAPPHPLFTFLFNDVIFGGSSPLLLVHLSQKKKEEKKRKSFVDPGPLSGAYLELHDSFLSSLGKFPKKGSFLKY